VQSTANQVSANKVTSSAASNLNPNNFRAVNELDAEFRSIFKEFRYFNKVQSLLFDEVNLKFNF
jgi:nucleotidyltransferase/DNA polymerase involved in DNA repair